LRASERACYAVRSALATWNKELPDRGFRADRPVCGALVDTQIWRRECLSRPARILAPRSHPDAIRQIVRQPRIHCRSPGTAWPAFPPKSRTTDPYSADCRSSWPASGRQTFAVSRPP